MRRDARPVNHFRMVIFDSPREAAVAAHPNPVLLPGNGEQFTGYGVAGCRGRNSAFEYIHPTGHA